MIQTKLFRPILSKITKILLSIILSLPLTCFSQSVIYVKHDAGGSNNGTSWTDAYTSLQSALDPAIKGDSIWVAAGTYKPSKDKTGNSSPADSRTKTFQLVDSVSLFGGFAGTETNFEDRNWKTNETILSGDIGVSDDISDNCYHVITGADSLQLNGFTITRGYASIGTGDDGHGGGIFLKNVSEFKLDFCMVKDNIASTGGGGMVINYCDSIEISNSVFLRDSVSWQGGAIQNGESSLKIKNSSFIKNTASLPTRGWGGAIFNVNEGATIDILNCTFIQNVAPRGEAIARYSTSSTVTVLNSILWQNKEGEIRGDCEVTYSVIRQDAYASNEGCIGDDPLLYVFGDDDLQIHELSTAIDAGDPASPLDPDASRADIGASWTIFSPGTELFVAEISSSIGQYVSGDNEITATITNRGLNTVTAMDIEWEINGIPQTTKNWTGSLGSMTTTDPVILGTCNLNFGENTIKVLTANPTPGPDEYTDNDSLQITVDAVTNLDIGIVSVVEPLDPFTYGLNDVRILFKNYSNDSTITATDIDFKIDDVAQTTYNWTGTLLPGEISDTVTIKGAHDFAEASYSIKVWTVSPNSNDDDDNSNDTLQVSVNGCSPLAGGTYTIGSGGDYSTFNDAINYLTSTCGIKGAFVFNVFNGTYDEQVTIPDIPGTSENFTITFQSSLGDSSLVILKNSSTGFTLKLDGVDYLTFKSITLAKENTSDNIVEIINNANSNSFENCLFTGSGTTGTLINDGSTNDNYNTISNCRLEGGNTGISLDGDAGTGYQLGVQISNNDFLDQKNKGIYCMEFKDLVISSNSIFSDSAITGIDINTDNAPGYHSIEKNSISINNEGTGISYVMIGSSGPISDTCLISNNFIHTKNFGLYFGYNNSFKTKVYNNSVNIIGTNSGSSAFYSGNSSAYFDLKNNILCNKGNGYAYDESGNTVERDYNNYFSNGEYIFNSYKTSEELMAAISESEHSISVVPAFESDSDLHASNPALNGAGTPLAEVTDDIDGEARHATTPDIGADEFVPCSSPLSGDYTIGGTSPDFETFTDAVNRLTGCGVTGPVTFSAASGVYTEQLYIPEISGVSGTNTITFQSATGDSSDVIITHTPLNETHSYTVLLNGTDYITFKNITFNTGENWGRTIELKNEATNNQFLNNKFCFEGTPLNDDDYAFIYSSGSLDSNNVFDSNLFENGSVGIYMNGSAASDSIAGIQIKNNIFADIVRRGVYLQKHKNLNISGNQFEILNSTFSFGLCITNSTGIIYNNFIQLETTGSGRGIYLQSSRFKVLHNTVKITGNSTSLSFPFYDGSSTVRETKNNIFVNLASGRALNCDTTNLTSDYNLLYTNGSLLVQSSINYANLSAWQAASGRDIHSISREPQFLSDTDLHTTDPWMNNWGTPMAEVTTDIDGEARDAVNPDVGADEFDGIMPFEGEYTIGTTGDFESFTEAIDTITPVGLSGPVTFKVQSGTYNEQIVVGAIPEISETNTVTFTSASGDSTDVILQFDATTDDNYTIKMDSCSYITFQNMTIKALDTIYARVVEFTGGASENILRNNVLMGLGTTNAIIYSTGDQDNNNQFNNNLITGGKIGIQMFGESASLLESGTEITANVFEDQFGGAVVMKFNKASLITNNLITHPDLVDGQWTGFYIDECSGSGSNYGLIANNVIAFNTETMSAGIVLVGSSYQKIYYNSVNIIGSTDNSRAFNQQDGGSNNYLYNNIFSNKSGGLVIFTKDVNSFTSDNNNYYTTGDKFIYYGISDTEYYWISDLATWQIDYSKDLNSYSVDPKFVSDANLLPGNIILDGSGTALAEVTEDFDGIPRDPVNPDIGAYEFAGCTTSGTFTIGPSGADYSTFEEAIESLQTCWVDGPIIFNVQSGTYNEQVIIQEIPGASETNTITFQSASGDSTDVILTYESTSADTNFTVKLDGADYIRLKNLTIQASGSEYARVIELSGGATNNQFHNSQFIGVNTTDPSNTNGALVYSPNGVAPADTSNIFSKNLFQTGSHGIYLHSHYSYIENNNQITGNRFEDQVSYGIYLYYQDSALISMNEISNTLSEKNYYGIYFYGTNSQLNKNEINLNNNRYNCTGLYITGYPYIKPNFLSNNFVHISTNGYGSITGMSLSANCNSYYNSINITGVHNSSYGIELPNSHYCVVKNNISVNNAGGYAISYSDGAADNVSSDYNDLYSNGSYLAKYNSINQTDLAEWTGATTFDTNSVSVDPMFVSDSDLHTQNPVINAAGTPIAEVTDDIDGESRDAVTPDIGADEFETVLYILGDNNNACAYDTVTLDAGNGYDSYSWSNGAATRFTDVDTSGVGLDSIKLVSSVTLGGQEYKDSLWVFFHKPVALTFDIDTCEYNYVDLNASGGVSYHWDASVTNPDTCCISIYLSNTILNNVVTVYDSYGCYDTDTATVVPYSKPSQPVIQFSNDSLVSSVTGTGYDWFLNSTTTGNTTQAILPQESGDYQVIVYNGGCPSDSSVSYNYAVGIEDIAGNLEITLYPNPSNGKLFMSFEKPFKDLRLSVINIEGQIVLSRLLKDVLKGFITELDLGDVPSGVYFVRFTNKEMSRTARIIVR